MRFVQNLPAVAAKTVGLTVLGWTVGSQTVIHGC
jgi:hypothetical protein